MRVLLINPPNKFPKDKIENIGIGQPIGLAYIAAELLKEGHEVNILDALAEGLGNPSKIGDIIHIGLKKEEIFSKISEFDPDVVGITAPFSLQIRSALEVAKIAKEVNNGIYTVLGGHHATIQPIEVVSHPDVDFVVIGEGEITTLELINKLEKGGAKDLADIKGIAYKGNGKPKITERRAFIQDLNDIPFPARYLLPLDKYFKITGSKWTPIITSRGCPYHCVFCAEHLAFGYKWRYRSPENVVDEIEEAINEYKIREVWFEDDNLTLNKKRTQRICELIIERKLDIEWVTRNGVRADTLDKTTLRLMKKSGCKQLWLAPESGSQRVVNEIIKKKLDLNKVEETVKLCKEVGIPVGCFFIMGLIGETKEDIYATIKYAHKLKKLGAHGFWFSIATPYFGTEFYDQAVNKGYLKEDLDPEALFVHEGIINTPEFSADWLTEVCNKAIKDLNRIGWNDIKRGLAHPKKGFRYIKNVYTKKLLKRSL